MFSSEGNNINDNTFRLYDHDDEYYLDIGSEPPRFASYRRIREEKWKALVQKPSDYDHSVTQDELDYYLKSKLRVPAEQRYQDKKRHWYFHESSWYMRSANGYDGQGCNQFTGCIPECRFYAQYGRIEVEEVIDEHSKVVESLKEENAIVEPPSESELLKTAKIRPFD